MDRDSDREKKKERVTKMNGNENNEEEEPKAQEVVIETDTAKDDNANVMGEENLANDNGEGGGCGGGGDGVVGDGEKEDEEKEQQQQTNRTTTMATTRDEENHAIGNGDGGVVDAGVFGVGAGDDHDDGDGGDGEKEDEEKEQQHQTNRTTTMATTNTEQESKEEEGKEEEEKEEEEKDNGVTERDGHQLQNTVIKKQKKKVKRKKSFGRTIRGGEQKRTTRIVVPPQARTKVAVSPRKRSGKLKRIVKEESDSSQFKKLKNENRYCKSRMANFNKLMDAAEKRAAEKEREKAEAKLIASEKHTLKLQDKIKSLRLQNLERFQKGKEEVRKSKSQLKEREEEYDTQLALIQSQIDDREEEHNVELASIQMQMEENKKMHDVQLELVKLQVEEQMKRKDEDYEKALASIRSDTQKEIAVKHRKEIVSLKKEWRGMEQQHQKEIAAVRSTTNKELREKEEHHQKEIAAIRATTKKELRENERRHQKETAAVGARTKKALREKEQQHQKELATVRTLANKRVKDMEEEMIEIKKQHRNEISDLRSKIKKTKGDHGSTLSGVRRDAKEDRTKAFKLEREVAKCRIKIEELQSINDKKNLEVKEYKSLLTNTEKQIKNSNNTINSLQQQVSELKLENRNLSHSKFEVLKMNQSIVREKQLATKQSMGKSEIVNRYETQMKLLTSENRKMQEINSELEIQNMELKKNAISLEASSPVKVIKKEHNKLLNPKGGKPRWPIHIWEVILEQLVNNTPPSSITSNIVSVVKTFSPNTKIEQMPHLNTIRRGRTVLGIVVQLLAAEKLGKSKKWKQAYTDATSRKQTAIVNLSVSIVDELGDFLPILLTTGIIPENEKSEELCKTILEVIADKGQLLDKWKQVHEELFGNDHDIPDSSELNVTKLANHGVITTDTCNSARKLSRLLREAIAEKARQEGILDEDKIKVHQMDCHHHLRNVWIGAMNRILSKYLAELMKEDLGNIDPFLRVSTNFDTILRAVDKLFSLCCNYAKGSGELFLEWMREYHPDSFLLKLQRGVGSRQDFTVEGAGAIYMNRRYYVEFLDPCLTVANDDILKSNVFIVLSSSEIIALSRVYAIFHVAICLPMRFLAGSTHLFAEHNWSPINMGQAIDILYDALEKIQDDGSKLLNYDFMMHIFDNIRDDLPPFDKYLTYMFEEKLNSSTKEKFGTTKAEFDDLKVVGFDLLIQELFYPERKENKDTKDLVIEMAVVAADSWMTEFTDPLKATSDYLTKAEGKYSKANFSEEEQTELLGTFATNDIAEQPFGRLTWYIDNFNRIGIGNAAAQAQARMNGDFDRVELGFEKDGAFHRCNWKKRYSLIATGLKYAEEERKKENEALRKQREHKRRKKELLLEKKILQASEDYTKALILIETYHSEAGWRSVEKIEHEYKNLKSETAKKEAMKLQIRIRVEGFGWKHLHHAWSTKGNDYSGDTLKDHLVNKILPYEIENQDKIPSVPSVELPCRKVKHKLGTLSYDTNNLNRKNESNKVKMVEAAKADIKTLDVNEKLQAPFPPTIDEHFVGKRIEVKFEMDELDDKGKNKLIWFKGEVIVVKNNKKDVIVRWDDENEIDSCQRLLPTKWNKQCDGSWRMDIGQYKILDLS